MCGGLDRVAKSRSYGRMAKTLGKALVASILLFLMACGDARHDDLTDAGMDAGCEVPPESGGRRDGDPLIDIVTITTEPYLAAGFGTPHPDRINQWLSAANVTGRWYRDSGWSVKVGIMSADACAPTWHWVSDSSQYDWSWYENHATAFQPLTGNTGLLAAEQALAYMRPGALKALILASPLPERSAISDDEGAAILASYDLVLVGGDGIRVVQEREGGGTETVVIRDPADRIYTVAELAGVDAVTTIASYQFVWYSALSALTGPIRGALAKK